VLTIVLYIIVPKVFSLCRTRALFKAFQRLREYFVSSDGERQQALVRAILKDPASRIFHLSLAWTARTPR